MKIKTQKWISNAQYRTVVGQYCTQIIKTEEEKKTLFSTLDLRYAYSQTPLDIERRNQCNFSLMGAKQQEHTSSRRILLPHGYANRILKSYRSYTH